MKTQEWLQLFGGLSAIRQRTVIDKLAQLPLASDTLHSGEWHKANAGCVGCIAEIVLSVSRNEVKRCNKCHKVKPESEFYRDRSKPDGYMYSCVECTLEMRARISTGTTANRMDIGAV